MGYQDHAESITRKVWNDWQGLQGYLKDLEHDYILCKDVFSKEENIKNQKLIEEIKNRMFKLKVEYLSDHKFYKCIIESLKEGKGK